MKHLTEVHMVQFSFWDYETFKLSPHGTGILGPNGAGKTTIIDAIQIALMGAHGPSLSFNAQSVHKDHRLLRDYALGTMRSGGAEDKMVLSRKREEAVSFITLIFRGPRPEDTVSAGVSLHSSLREPEHRVLGLYVLPGVELSLEDHLEELENDEGKAPMDWQQFEQLVRARAKAAGSTPLVTMKADAYLDELLHQIEDPAHPIKRRQFIRALKHSINLKEVNSVGDFLRGYLVEPAPIDKRGLLTHIKQMRLVSKKIEQVQEQLAKLDGFERRFESLAQAYRMRDVARAVRQQLLMESSDAAVGRLGMEAENLESSIKVDAVALEKLQLEAESLRGEHLRLTQEFSKDPQARDPLRESQIAQMRSAALLERRRKVEGLEIALRTAAEESAKALKDARSAVAARAQQALAAFESLGKGGPVADVDAMKALLGALRQIHPELQTQEKEDRIANDAAQDRLKDAEEKSAAARRGMRLLAKSESDSHVAHAVRLFREEGIETDTVSSVIKVTDIHWQGAIEAFLGRNRNALLVAPGGEQAATRLLRHARPAIYDVTIVQPEHLKGVMGRRYGPDMVASLLEGLTKDRKSDLALAYLGNLMGELKKASTESELERYSRALTADGMLSANGGTRRIRLVEPNEWRLGVKVSDEDHGQIKAEIEEAAAHARRCEQRRNLSRQAEESVRMALQRITPESYSLACTEFHSARTAAMTASSAAELPAHLKALQLEAEKAKARAVETEGKVGSLREKLGSDRSSLLSKQAAHGAERLKLEEMVRLYQESIEAPDFDSEASVQLYEKCGELASGGPQEALNHLDETRRRAEGRIAQNQPLLMSEFLVYVNDNSVGVVDERNDWRKARQWVRVQTVLLRDSTLVDYQRHAAEAKEAANQAFRSEVKFKMREAITKVRLEIDELNRILGGCPEFTGGERYEFSCKVAPLFKPLHDLIMDTARDGFALVGLGDGAAAPTDEAQQQLMALFEASEAGTDRGNNPLEDYRLLFNFDLNIKVSGKVVDTLSKRMGVGSNGEHRVPFYVIAGAALASAYRIKPNSNHRGAALMLIDEAFYGMDAQNSYTTSTFLKSLGLQLIMAGPDSDEGKLLPTLESFYSLYRDGVNSHLEYIEVSDAARKLLLSDIPEQNPQLMEATMKRLERARMDAAA